MVSCDLVWIPDEAKLQKRVRKQVRADTPEIQEKKIVLSATHTHTAPVMIQGLYEIPEEGVMQPEEYTQFLVNRLSEIIVSAWKKLPAGSTAR